MRRYDTNKMVTRPFEESAENRKALDDLVRERRKNIDHAIDKLDGLRPPPPPPTPRPRRKTG